MKPNTFALAFASVAVAVAVVSGRQTPAPEQPGVTFRSEVNYVEVDARVLDAQGRFVRGLTQADFEVLEDGKPQPIAIFSLVDIPVERTQRPLFASRPIEPDVQTNQSGYNGRVYLFVLDDIHTHPLRSSRVKLAVRQFVERHLGANDIAALVHTSGRSDAAQEFTSNPRLLLSAADKFMGRKLRASLLGRLEEEQRTRGMRQPGDRIDDPDAFERGYNATSTLSTLKNFAEIMSGVRGRRKALVYFSEGIDYDITNPFDNRDASEVMSLTRDIIAAATRANVAIYGVDVRGLGAGMDDAIEIQSLPDDPSLGLNTTGLFDEVRRAHDNLRTLSEETGGFAVVNTNDIQGAFARLVEENSSYYVLGYNASNERRDGRFRNIEVRVRKAGLTVRSRRGYYAPRGRAPETRTAGPNGASPELRDAMSSPVPVSGLPLATTASVFRGPDGKGSVVISTLIGGRDLPLVERDGAFRNDLEVAFGAIDEKGKYHAGDRNTVNLALKPDSVPRVRATGFRVISLLELPPGRYQLRVAAREANGKRSGLVLNDVEVPDFSKPALAMSSIALTSSIASQAPTARPKDPLQKLLPGPLITVRDFMQNDEIATFVEVYENGRAAAHKVEIALTLKAEGGQTVFQTREERDSSELGGSAGGYGFSARIPLRDVAPGLYVLRVEAQSRIADREAVARETIINVLPAPGTPASAAERPQPPPTPQGGTPPATPAPAAPMPTPPSAPAPEKMAPDKIEMVTLNSDRMSGIDRAQQSVIRTDAEWQKIWREHAPGRPAPAVDFAKQMVLAVFLGSRPSAGYGVLITSVETEGNELVVRWTEGRPAAGMSAATVMTAPSHIVAVPRREGTVRFERVER